MGGQAHAVIARLIAHQDPQSSRARTRIRGQLQTQGEVGGPFKKSYRLLKDWIGENLRLSLFDADQIGGVATSAGPIRPADGRSGDMASPTAQRIEKPNSGKVFLIIRDHQALIRPSDSGDDHVEPAARSTCGFSLGHQFCPEEARLFVEGQDTAGKKNLRPLRSGEPSLENHALVAARFLQDASTNFSQRKRGDEQIFVTLGSHPRHQRF